MAKTKIPAKIYVTGKYEYWDKTNPTTTQPPTPLGFLNGYDPGKSAFAAKRRTQEEWAYKDWGWASFAIEQHGPEFWIVGDKYGPWPSNGGQRTLTAFRNLCEPQPQIWDNVPLNGFRIDKSVSRYSTSNKLWRILDPRGFQFEISTLCLEQIIEDAGIRKGGEIDGKCVWMSNKNLVVVP